MFESLRIIQNQSSVVPSNEGMIGDLFKSKATHLKERIEKAIQEIDTIKKRIEQDRVYDILRIHKNLEKYEYVIGNITKDIKGKRFDQKSFDALEFEDDWGLNFSALKHDIDLHKPYYSLIDELLHGHDTDKTLEKLKGIGYTNYGADNKNNWVDINKDPKVSSGGGYPPSFVQYAISVLSIEKSAAEAMISLSSELPTFIDKQKQLVSQTADIKLIPVIVARTKSVAYEVVWYALSGFSDGDRLTTFAEMAALIARHCYK